MLLPLTPFLHMNPEIVDHLMLPTSIAGIFRVSADDLSGPGPPGAINASRLNGPEISVVLQMEGILKAKALPSFRYCF